MGTANTNKLIKTIVEIKKENETLEELVNFMRMENFELALKCNRMEIILSEIEPVIKNCPAKLLEASDNIYAHLSRKSNADVTNTDVLNMKRPSSGQKLTKPAQKSPSGGKAHVVKPHMVNGHVLYVPTINLTRMSNLQTSPNSNNSGSQINDRNTSTDNTSSDTSNNLNAESSNNGEQEVDSNENQGIIMEESVEPSTSSPSKSPLHSTVLSGTFQEVKIYLNQVSPENLSESSKELMTKTRLSRKSRKTVSFTPLSPITKRKRS